MNFYYAATFCIYTIASILFVLSLVLIASAQVVDRDMTLEEPTTTVSGSLIQNLQDCVVDVVDLSGVPDQRIIAASSPNGGGEQTIDLTGKLGFTTVTALCRNTLVEESTSVSLTRTFPGEPPANPTLRD